MGRARLVVLQGAHPGRKFVIEGGVVLGRSTEAHVQFDDGEISRRHARINWFPGEGFVIEDLGSRNGTFVNGALTKRGPLAFGDEVRLGPRTLLRFGEIDPQEELLLQQERLQALGRLAAGVAHDVNNMLSAIGANVEWLHGLPPQTQLSEADVRESLADIVTAAARATELTRGILAFARGKGRGRSRVDVSTLATEVMKLLRHAVPREITVESEVETGLFVYGDRVELHQVLMNLLLNARDAMPDGGVLRLTARSAIGDGGQSSTNNAQHVVLTVQDTGVGMDENTRARIFDPFFSTKNEGSSVGLGLATVREVVEYHGGQISVESTPGEGSSFSVFLPADTSRGRERWVTSTLEQRPTDLPRRRAVAETVLLVDDEAVVQRSLGRLLRREGYEVLFASSGSEAIEVYRAATRRPDLVLMDLEMPGMSGEEAIEALLAMDSTVRVMVMSGDHGRGVELQGVVGHLDKPCDAQVLVNEVRSAFLGPIEPEVELTSPR
jgi:signal transduction histidine kinase